MKKIFVIVGILCFAGLAYADVDTRDGAAITTSSNVDGFSSNIDKCDGQTVKATGGCTPSYNELNNEGHATDPDATDAETLTGWTSGVPLCLSAIYEDEEACGEDCASLCSAPSIGTYAIFEDFDENNARVYRQFGAISGVDHGDLVRVKIDVLSDGSNAIGCSLNLSSVWTSAYGLVSYDNLTPNTFTTYTFYARVSDGYGNADLDYVVCQERNDAGYVYIDNFSVCEATLCYGTALYNDDAADDPSSEGDSTGGWTGSSGVTVASVDTGDSVCGAGQDSDCPDPADGTYHIFFHANGNSNGHAYLDLSSVGLQNAQEYQIDYYIRHGDGYGDNTYLFFNDTADVTTPTMYVEMSAVANTTYIHRSFLFTYSADYRYLVLLEYGANDIGGVFIDALQFIPVTSK